MSCYDYLHLGCWVKTLEKGMDSVNPRHSRCGGFHCPSAVLTDAPTAAERKACHPKRSRDSTGPTKHANSIFYVE